jgi:hypothetical protein
MTALALRDVDTRWARKKMTVVGARIVMKLRGVSCLPLETCPPAKKFISCTRSFPVVVRELDELREAVAVYTTRAGERLRCAGLAARAMTVFVQTNLHNLDQPYSNSTTVKMIYPTVSTQECRPSVGVASNARRSRVQASGLHLRVFRDHLRRYITVVGLLTPMIHSQRNFIGLKLFSIRVK